MPVRPSYTVMVIDCRTGSNLRLFDSTAFEDLKYNRALNGVGALVMTLDFDESLLTLFARDNFIEVIRTHPVTGLPTVEDTYFCRLTHRFRDGNEERFIVGGLSLNHLLSRRIIDPADDPLGAGGYSTKAGPADDVLRAFAREQCGDLSSADRQFPNFIIDASPGNAGSVGMRARYDNLLNVFQDLALQGKTDFRIYRGTGSEVHLAIAPIGRNRTRSANYPYSPFTQFEPNRGNLFNPSLVTDAKKEQNYCYALGQGQGDSRIVAEVQGATVFESPFNRIEYTEDVRKSERDDSLYLLTGANKSLQENQPQQEFTFQLMPDAPGAVYHIDFELGDFVTAAWGEVSSDLRVTDVEVQISKEGETITPKLEDTYSGR